MGFTALFACCACYLYRFRAHDDAVTEIRSFSIHHLVTSCKHNTDILVWQALSFRCKYKLEYRINTNRLVKEENRSQSTAGIDNIVPVEFEVVDVGDGIIRIIVGDKNGTLWLYYPRRAFHYVNDSLQEWASVSVSGVLPSRFGIGSLNFSHHTLGLLFTGLHQSNNLPLLRHASLASLFRRITLLMPYHPHSLSEQIMAGKCNLFIFLLFRVTMIISIHISYLCRHLLCVKAILLA